MTRAIEIVVLLLLMETQSLGIEMPAPAQAYYERAETGLGFLPPGEGGEQFIQFVAEHWEPIAQDFSSFAPDLRRQTLVAIAAQGLAPRDYIRFVSLVCDQVAAKKVSPDVIQTFLLSKQRKSGFFAVNYDAPEVRALVAKFKQLVPADKSDLRSLLNGIESGKAKNTFLMWQKAEDAPTPEVLGADVFPADGSAKEKAAAPASSPAMPVQSTPPAASAQPTPSAPTPAARVEPSALVWPWLVGIAAVIVIAALALKRRV
jgi:hypothetical protein